MPWTCPACQTAIRHSDVEEMPRLGVVYRCHICRLELVLDLSVKKMTVAPMPSDRDRPTTTAKNTR